MSVNIAFSISKHAMNLIKAGKAILSSGGVRALTGQFIEQAVPVATSSSGSLPGFNIASATVNIASSLASNIQCAYIQKSVNLANVKLNQVLDDLGIVSNSLHALQQIKALSWVTSAFSLANCGISIAGFALTLNRLESINGQLKEFYDRYRQDRASDKFLEFNRCLGIMKDHLAYLKERYENSTFDDIEFKNRSGSIEESLSKTKAFIQNIIDEFCGNNIEEVLACQIIFTLAPVYSQLLREFTCQYRYVHDCAHKRYDEWRLILNEIKSQKLKNRVKNYLVYKENGVSPAAKNAAYQLAFRSISEQETNLLTGISLADDVSRETYFQLDTELNKGIFDTLSKAITEFEGIELDSEIVKRIKAGNYHEHSNMDTITVII